MRDLNGRIVYREGQLSINGKNVHALDLSDLANGLYFYPVRTASDMVSGKLLKH
ncbi:MAG: hypothetical protein AB8H12_00375 [Lewinella sp.]